MPPPGKGFAGKLSKKSKAPKGGPRDRNLKRTQDFKKTEEGKAAIEKGLRKALAGEGKSDISKYDDKTAKAIQGVDFRNSPIGRSLLADQFKRGDITATDFADYLVKHKNLSCLLYTSPSPRDPTLSRMPSSA